MSRIDTNVDSADSTRISVRAVNGKGFVEISTYDDGVWWPTDEARLDVTGLKALAALCLITAEEIERAK